MNTGGELELAANRAEPENQAEAVPGPDHDKTKKCNFFQKIKSTTMSVHYVKGQPGASTYVREKGVITSDTIRATPCPVGKNCRIFVMNAQFQFDFSKFLKPYF